MIAAMGSSSGKPGSVKPGRGRRVTTRIAAALLFIAGVLVGTVFFAVATWADFEASLFNPGISGATTLATMRCPVVVTSGQTATVTASFHNPGPNATSPTVRLITSLASIISLEQTDRRFTVEPGEIARLEWEVPSESPVWGLFQFVKIYQFASFPLQSASGSCGIVVLDVRRLSGGALTTLMVAASLLAMAAGLWLRIRTTGARSHRRMVTPAMATLAALVSLGLLTALFGQWLPGLVLLVLVVVLALAIATMVLAEE